MASLAAYVPLGIGKRLPCPINGYNATQGGVRVGFDSMRTAPIL
jgi:hypothetical protein